MSVYLQTIIKLFELFFGSVHMGFQNWVYTLDRNCTHRLNVHMGASLYTSEPKCTHRKRCIHIGPQLIQTKGRKYRGPHIRHSGTTQCDNNPHK